MQPNTVGTPNTNDYLLGRGVLYFAPLLDSGLPGAYRDLGNSPDFKINVATEKLKHANSRGGLKVTDKEVEISKEANISFTLDEMNLENVNIFFAGIETAFTNPAVAGFTIWTLIAAGTIELGRWYDLTKATGERVYDVLAAKVLLKTTNATPVTLVDGTDYTLDLAMGRIFLISTSTKLATAITNVEGVTLTLTADSSASSVKEVQALSKSSIKGALKFVGTNPANNEEPYEVQCHQISLKADGDLSLISDDWATVGFTGVAERNTSVPGNSKSITIRSLVAARNVTTKN